VNSDENRATIGFTAPPALAAVTARYELHAEVGRGGMGIVYKARDRQTADLVAIKVIHPSIASDPRLIERFRNELLLARRVTHKNVCRVHDLTDFGGVVVISMEFVDGRSLHEVLKDVESMSTRQGMKIVRQIIAGLAEAHAQGIVHRDLKPENLLVARDGAVKIMDFGIARLMDSRTTATGTFLGTPAYMSPEQAEGKPADTRSDIYSLGLLMYEMFCGRPAFMADTPVAFVAKHVGEVPPAPRTIEPDLPVRIDAAIQRCLEKHPDKRFQSVEELGNALYGEAATTPIDADGSVAPLPDHIRRWHSIDWGLLAAAALGLIVFFPCYARTGLASRSQVTVDWTTLRRIADEHLQRLGAPPTPVKQLATSLDPGPYVYLATRYGAAAARDLTNNPVHYWTWSVAFQGASLNVDQRGRLTSFVRDPIPIDSPARSPDQARQQAAQAIHDFFGQTTSTLELEHETKGQVFSFAWLGPPNAYGLRERYSADVDKLGISSLSSAPELPPGFTIEHFPFGEVTMNEWGMPVAVLISVLVCGFGFVNRRRVTPAPWRTALVVVSFIVGTVQTFSSMRFFGVGEMLSLPVALGVMFAVIAHLGSITLEVLLKRKDAYKLDTFAVLFRTSGSKDTVGLSVIRGCAIGLLLLGVDTFATWLGTTFFRGRLSIVYVGLVGGAINGATWPIGVVLGIALVQMVGLGLLVAFAYCVAMRLPFPAWFAVVAAAAALAATGIRSSMAAVEPWPFIAVVLFIDFLLLIVSFRRFDLLTVLIAIGTFAFWWANYPLFVMLQPIGAAGPSMAFVAWGLVIAAALWLAFQATLRRGYRRLAAAFD
jgi:hypothetical protein